MQQCSKQLFAVLSDFNAFSGSVVSARTVFIVQAQQLQQQLQHQPHAVSHKAALQIGEVATQKLIQLDNVHVTGGHAACTNMHSHC